MAYCFSRWLSPHFTFLNKRQIKQTNMKINSPSKNTRHNEIN
ncbi:hypothetical protein YPPY13_3338 [Yersinia pestis PY-13]|uniref:Uncharacterized protein n=2 Tax=Yersinia pestis TaxID=632 RepID=A0AAV3BK51_YERPE|nr:hypothetical protein YPC_3079 [Yersinia pestis biovar Medievalis str. Harbin 35]EDR33550.1 hypothetical protein YPIP275_2046 [Yersinia pestis biovar Orientalis str. IP275]EDR39439.1 hypothetical protein YpF1991016_3610 [Yersinia pestis biovar Orientalis str. F1991016]EDR44794.1 hypothetical protein YpE1979001_1442 [Yersinia pestis biovar Antiqua str. E1979001]EDR50848.1 hypothetical protein YpB42003004_0802 [Yersinia pestis biovar Antiqua str. B42003004]EDR56794.1 hypothetical protein YpMG0